MFEKRILQCLDNFPDNVWPKYVGGVYQSRHRFKMAAQFMLIMSS